MATNGTPKEPEKKVKLWDKRVEVMREAHTTPRDIYERNILAVHSRNKEVRKNVRFLWISDIMLKNRPMLTGFSWDLYQPVTRELADEFELELETNQLNADGVIKAGADANLYWAPEELCQEQDRIMRGEPFRVTSQRAQEQLDDSIRLADANPIGEVVHSKDWREIEEAANRSREGMNRDLLESLKDNK